MTAEGALFAGFDPVALDRATEAVGTRMAASIATTILTLVRDPAISPELLSAALIRAHLLGAASAIASAESAGAIAINDPDQLVGDVAATILATLAEMRARR